VERCDIPPKQSNESKFLGFAFHLNTSLPFYALQHEIVIKGRPSNNIFYPEMLIADNWWGGILVGNYCLPEGSGYRPRVRFIEILGCFCEFGGK
jgi:hypothetical protein